MLPIAASVYLLLRRLFGGALVLHCHSGGSLFHADASTATPFLLRRIFCCFLVTVSLLLWSNWSACWWYRAASVYLVADASAPLSLCMLLCRSCCSRFHTAAGAAMLLQCSCCCRPCSAVLCCCTVAAAVGYFMMMVPLPRRSSVPAAAAPLQIFFIVSVSLAAVVVELNRMLVLPRRYISSAPLLLCMCYCVAAAVWSISYCC